MKKADVSVSILVLAVVMIIIIHLPTWLMDTLLIMNIAISVFIMLAALYIKNVLDFSIMPTLLLLTTLFRLALNLSSTKLILGNGGNAGRVIETFGNFVIGGNLVVGIVVFIIIVAIQFIVIIMVTRSASGNTFGGDVMHQIKGNRGILTLCGYVLLLLGLVPGLPKVQIFLLAVACIATGLIMKNRAKRKEQAEAAPQPALEAEKAAAEKRKPENVLNLLQVEPLELEFGYGLVPMVDVSLGGDLLERIVMIRRQCAIELGIVMPSVRLRDNVRLKANEYVLKIRGDEVARGEVMPDHYLAINSDGAEETISGIETVEPTFGLPALWITKKQREKAELLGYTTIDPPSVITTHLIEMIKNHAGELMDRQQVQMLVDNLAKQQPTLVEEVVPKMFSFGELQRVLSNLLNENIPIKNLSLILETMAECGPAVRDTEVLTERIRQSLSRVITRRFLETDDVSVIVLDSGLEQLILERSRKTDRGTVAILEPEQLKALLANTHEAVKRNSMQGKKTVVLTSPGVRARFKRLIAPTLPEVTVLSYGEVEQSCELQINGVIGGAA